MPKQQKPKTRAEEAIANAAKFEAARRAEVAAFKAAQPPPCKHPPKRATGNHRGNRWCGLCHADLPDAPRA